MKQALLASALVAVLSSTEALARPNDIDADKSARRKVDDPMDVTDCDKIYQPGKYFPTALAVSTYKQADCATPLFWDGPMLNADRHAAGFDKLPLCLGMGENIDFYLKKYPGKCRRLTSSHWTQDLNQKLIWCAAKGYLKGNAIWLVNNKMMSKKFASQKLGAGKLNGTNSLYVTASEACFWTKVMGKPFPLSGKEKAAQASASKAPKKAAPKGHSGSSAAHP